MKEFNKFLAMTIFILFVVFGTMGAGVLLRGTASTDFTIDYDNAGAEADMTITFNRGSTSTVDAEIRWDSTADTLESNVTWQAVPKVLFQGTAQLTDGSAAGKTVSYMDDSPSGEHTDSEGAGRVVMSDDATYYKMGAKSLKMAFDATAIAEDGSQYVAGQPFDFSDDENVGFWLYSSIALNGNDLAYEIQDNGGEQVMLIGAIAATTWTWVSLTLPGANGDKDVISEQRIVQKVDKGAMDLYVDALFKWDSTEDTALTESILTDGDFAAISDITAGGAWNNEVRYTDYFIDYDSTDNLVIMTDQSANKWVLGYAFE